MIHMGWVAVREFAKKSAASAASRDFLKFQAVVQSAAKHSLPGEAALATDWITTSFSHFLAERPKTNIYELILCSIFLDHKTQTPWFYCVFETFHAKKVCFYSV